MRAMRRFKGCHHWLAIQAILLLAAVLLVAAPLRGEQSPVSEEEIEKIEAAMPTRATAVPAKARKVLVFSRCEGYYHEVIPLATQAFRIMGEKTGAFEAVMSRDMAMFNPDTLRPFDAILFNNTTHLKFDDPDRRQALLDFVRGGKGVIGIHAASDNFYDWPEAAEMMGGLFDGHPWTADGTWAVKIDEPEHPLNRAFGGKGFLIRDEIYQMKAPYSRDKLRVLLSLDMTNARNLEVSGIKREDQDHAISWIRRFGQGRVFYCSLGHNREIFWNPAILQHYLDGIQFALGDLEADARPSATLERQPEPALTTTAGAVEDPYQKLLHYDFDQSREPLSIIEEEIRQADAKQREEIEIRLLTVLQSPEATFAARQFVCRMLRRIGTNRSVPALAELLEDEQLSHMARYALQRMPSREVDSVFRQALDRLQGNLRIGLIGSIADRGDTKAVSQLAGLAASADLPTAQAAITALGRIGGPGAVKALAQLKVSEELRLTRTDAQLACAERLLAEGATSSALQIYRELSSEENPVQVRIAGYGGLVRAEKEKALPVLIAMLKSPETRIQKAAGPLIRELPGDSITEKLAELLDPLSADAQVVLLDALAARGNPGAAAAVAREAEDPRAVREAAIRALGALGGAENVELLAYVTMEDDVGPLARESLARLRGEGVNARLLELAQDREIPTPVQATLIEVLVQRHAPEAVPVLIQLAGNPESPVRQEALRALASLADEQDLATLVALLPKTQSESERSEAEKTIVSICRKGQDPRHQAEIILTALETSAEAAHRGCLLRIIGRVAAPWGLVPLRTALQEEDEEIQKEAVRALSDWPEPAPLEDLLEVAQKTSSPTLRVLALRGCARLLTLPSERPVEKTLEAYEQALPLAERDEEKKQLLSGLSGIRHPRALELVKPFCEVESLKEEAQLAVEKIAGLLSLPTSASASSGEAEVQNAIDGDPATRWSTRETQRSGQWFMADMGVERPIAKITLDAGSEGEDYPRGYEVYVSSDPNDWGAPVAAGEGSSQVVEISFPPTTGRYVKIIQTGQHSQMWWSICELRAAE